MLIVTVAESRGRLSYHQYLLAWVDPTILIEQPGLRIRLVLIQSAFSTLLEVQP